MESELEGILDDLKALQSSLNERSQHSLVEKVLIFTFLYLLD